MSKLKVAVIVGSLRKESINLKLAKMLVKLGEEQFDANFVRIDDLPLFNQDLESDFPKTATRMKQEIEAAGAVLFVTPEYNRAMPGPLKNAIDWLSRPYGKNSLAKKPAGIIGASPGATGTACSQHNLRATLSYLDVYLMNQPEAYIQFKNDLADESTQKFLQKYVDALVKWCSQQDSNL